MVEREGAARAPRCRLLPLRDLPQASTLKKPSRSSTSGDPGYIASAVEQMASVAEGLEEAHRLGLVHRDVKPSNIIAERSGRYGSCWDDKAHWSPDGNLLYFISDRDGSWCVYAQRLDPTTKRPVEGGLAEVLHLHGGRLSPRNMYLPHFDIAVAPGRLVLNLGERTGNVWLAELEED